jgi:hypothetical protein
MHLLSCPVHNIVKAYFTYVLTNQPCVGRWCIKCFTCTHMHAQTHTSTHIHTVRIKRDQFTTCLPHVDLLHPYVHWLFKHITLQKGIYNTLY